MRSIKTNFIFTLTLTFILLEILAMGFANAGSRVAFLKVYDHHGRLVQYEPASQFGHTALEVQGQWLQSYPGEGTQLVSLTKLKTRGTIDLFIELEETYLKKDIAQFLNIPFDFDYDWENENLYCSELIAKILQIPPEPMQFNKQVWPKSYWQLEGKLGLSPDKLFRALKN